MASNITYWHNFPSNFSNGTKAVDGIGTLFQYANEGVGGWMGIFILFMVGGISFITMKTPHNVEKAFSASMFIVLMISILLLRLEMIAIPLVFMITGVFIVSLILIRGDANRGNI